MIFLLPICFMTFLGALGAFFFKRASAKAEGLETLIKEPQLYIGGMLYVMSALLNIVLLRYMDYSVLYPMTAITYIWTLLLSNVLLRERITSKKLLGILCICFGIFLLKQ